MRSGPPHEWLYSTGSQLGDSFAPGDFFIVVTSGRRLLLASRRQRPGSY